MKRRPERLLAASLEDGRPNLVLTCQGPRKYVLYRCAYNRRLSKLFYWRLNEFTEAVFLPDGMYWAQDGVKLKLEDGIERLAALPPEYDQAHFFENAEEEDGSHEGVCCQKCQEYQPVGRECEHVWYCRFCGSYQGAVLRPYAYMACIHPDPNALQAEAAHAALLAGHPLKHMFPVGPEAMRNVWIVTGRNHRAWLASLHHPYCGARRLAVRRDDAVLAQFVELSLENRSRIESWWWILYDSRGHLLAECKASGRRPGVPTAWADDKLRAATLAGG